MRTAILFLALTIVLSGAVTAAPSKKQQDYDDWLLSNQPFDKVPVALDTMKKHGTVTPDRYQKLMAEWQAKKPEWDRKQAANRAKNIALRKKKERERVRELAALTPAQRLDLEMRQKELDFQHQQFDAQMAQRAENEKQARKQAVLAALAGVTNQATAQIREDQRRQEDFNRALILQQMRNSNPRTYDSTVTRTYPGGPIHVHTEERGGY